MHRIGKQSIVLLVVVALLALPYSALADSEEERKDPQIKSVSMIGDALIARPLGLVATVAGFGLFIVASPFALISQSAGDTWDALVVYPARFTFTRPMGEFD